jgi:hypothetical protein
METCILWVDGPFRPIDRLCVASMVHAGQKVRLFSYGHVPNAPAGIQTEDARSILPEHFTGLVKRGVFNMGQFSDLFRIALMKQARGVWLDTDIYLVKPFSPDPAKPFLAWENEHRLGVAALYLPADNPVIGEFDSYLADFLAGRRVLPNWLGFRRRVLRPLYYKAIGKKLVPAKAGITIYGNDGITRLARRHGFINLSAPKETFYYWASADCMKLYDGNAGMELIEHPDFIGIHFSHKSPDVVNAPPSPGSFYHWAQSRIRESTRA